VTIEELRYALAKQLASASAIETDYGSIVLDAELRAEVAQALREIFEARLSLALAIEGHSRKENQA
jgi:hypothetical protein